jgi:hypothetical protein
LDRRDSERVGFRWRRGFEVGHWSLAQLGFGCLVGGVVRCAEGGIGISGVGAVKLFLHHQHLLLRFLDLLQAFVDLGLQRVGLPAHGVTRLFLDVNALALRRLLVVVVNTADVIGVPRG